MINMLIWGNCIRNRKILAVLLMSGRAPPIKMVKWNILAACYAGTKPLCQDIYDQEQNKGPACRPSYETGIEESEKWLSKQELM